MIPQKDTLDFVIEEDLIQEKDNPTLTYAMDLENKRIVGKVNKLNALKQRIYKEILTERYQYPIYKEYGVIKADLFGKPKAYAYTVFKARVIECIESYPEVNQVIDFRYIPELSVKDKLAVSFTVESIYGDFNDKVVIKFD